MPATKGPWEFDRDTGIVGNVELDKVVSFIRGNADDEEACANGALIAAAPDMAELLAIAKVIMKADRMLLNKLSAFPEFSSAGKAREDIDQTIVAIEGVLAQAKGAPP